MKKALAGIAGGMVGAVIAAAGIKKMNDKVIREKEDSKQRYKKYYDVLNYWMESGQRGKSIAACLLERNYRKVVIYGMGEMGNRLYEQLRETDIEVLYAIDKKPVSRYAELNVVGVAMETSDVDAVIVTPIYDFDKIKGDLEGSFGCEILSLEEVIYAM